MYTSLLLALIMSLTFVIQSAPLKRQSDDCSKIPKQENERLMCFYCAADGIKTNIQKLAEVRNKIYTTACNNIA